MASRVQQIMQSYENSPDDLDADKMAVKPKKKISIKPSHKGLLHKKLGVAPGKKIPAAKIASAKKSKSPALRKEATFAKNFGK